MFLIISDKQHYVYEKSYIHNNRGVVMPILARLQLLKIVCDVIKLN